MEQETKRKKGGQKGNQNALKHGYYSKIFNEAERIDYCSAGGIEGIDEELALLRHEIKNAISGGDERNLLLLVKAATALDKLMRTRYQITSNQHKNLKDAIAGVFTDLLVPMGVNFGSAILTRKFGGQP
jgi:hypothetical protein